MSGLDIPLEGKGIRQLCGTVLIMEAIVIGLAIPVAIVLEQANRGVAGGVGGGLAICALLIGGVVGRPRMGWALWAGTVLQALVIAAGVVVPAHVCPRRDLRRPLGHRHLAGPPPRDPRAPEISPSPLISLPLPPAQPLPEPPLPSQIAPRAQPSPRSHPRRPQ